MNSQDQIFSRFATHKLQADLTIYSTRKQVNVINPMGGNDSYSPAHGSVLEYVRECVRKTVKPLGWTSDLGWLTYVSPDYSERGKYRATVWRPRRPNQSGKHA